MRERPVVDLNSDLGESFGSYVCGLDSELIPALCSANVACGFHAGDPDVLARTVALCKKHGVAVGAHPGFPDLMGFGRRNMALSPAETKNAILYQLGAIGAFCRAEGVPLRHVKTHGAMYNMAAKDPALAAALAEAIAAYDPSLILLGLAGSELLRAGKAAGLRVASEVFADRGYRADGSLVPRSQPGAMIHDPNEAIERVVRMLREGVVRAVSGEDVPIRADSVCVHGDNPQARAFVQKIRARLLEEGIALCPLGDFIGD